MEVTARYFDGQRPTPRHVTLRRRLDMLEIVSAEGETVIWHLSETRMEPIGAEIRLHRVQEEKDSGERLIAEASAFEVAFPGIISQFGRGRAGEASAKRVIIWSAAAIVSLVFLTFVGIPLFARLAAPLVPWAWEERLGRAIEPQILPFFGEGKALKACGKPSSPSHVALQAMVERLAAGADLPGPLRVDVLDTSTVNAFALPGGRIFIFRAIIDKADTPDEVAGVLAHEIGHVIHRDAMRAIINDSALSVVVGIALGDISGGFTVGAMKSLLGSSYSRDHENQADQVSVALMRKAGADPKAINRFFRRISPLEGKGGSALDLLRSHPLTEDRIKAVEALAAGGQSQTKPVLSETEWKALREICRETRENQG